MTDVKRFSDVNSNWTDQRSFLLLIHSAYYFTRNRINKKSEFQCYSSIVG